MCKVFIGADASLWESQTRSIRMEGVVTSVRLERMFWMVLEEIAVKGDLTVPQLLHQFYNESIDAGHDLGNFTSFLRVCCLRFTDLQAQGLLLDAAGRDRLAEEVLRLEADTRRARDETCEPALLGLEKPGRYAM